MNFRDELYETKKSLIELQSVYPLFILLLLLAYSAFLLQNRMPYSLILSLGGIVLGISIIRHLFLPNNERIKKIFIGLKEKGAIKATREIRCDKRVRAFKSGMFFYNTIFYDEKSCNLDEDTITFALLHEEGHKINKQYVTPPLFFILFLIAVPMFFYILANAGLVLADYLHLYFGVQQSVVFLLSSSYL